MLTTVLFALWCFGGSIVLGLFRIRTPQDTLEGKENPDVAFVAWAVMLVCWPVTVWNRRKFTRFGDEADEANPTWLSDG